MIDLKFSHISKRYAIRQEADVDTSRNPIVRKIQNLRRPARDFWAVRDVSFEVERGETLGIIGHNGAGKSTVLKMLANVTTPTSGEITINGRLSALIEVGSGFHPELTGRENIYLNGSILGMRRREITEKLDRIVDFADIRQFLDTPVKRFSSGMYVRLGFSIAAHLDPDILLLDEVLAVGDAPFQAKCLQRITELKQAGTTIVFISHDLGAVERICSRVILMRRGEIAANGTAREVIAEYQRAGAKFVPSAPPNMVGAKSHGKARITSLAFLNSEGDEINAFRTGEALTVRVGYTTENRLPATVVEVFFYAQDGELHCQFTSELSGRIDLEAGTGTVEFHCGEVCLQQGIYNIDVTIEENDWQYQCATLRVDPGDVVTRGVFFMPHVLRHVESNNGNVNISIDEGRSEKPVDDLVTQV